MTGLAVLAKSSYSANQSLDIATILTANGQACITYIFVYGNDTPNVTYSAVWLHTRSQNGVFERRDILASNAPGNNNGAINYGGTTVSCGAGGGGTGNCSISYVMVSRDF
jgi:hypothetical protein